MSEPALLAEHIDRQTNAILAVWRDCVNLEGDVPESENLSRAEFVDHVPEILDRLADRLRGGSSDAVAEGRKHGELRWRQGYDVAEIVREFGHLRTALTRATLQFAQTHGWRIPRLEETLEVVNDVVSEATAESVRQFQEDCQEATETALAEAKQRQIAVEDARFAAQNEEGKFQTILANLPAAVLVVDAEGTVVGVNKEAERTLGITLANKDQRISIFDSDGDYPIFQRDGAACPTSERPIVRALRGEVVTQEEFIWVVRGEAKTITVNATPLTDSSGRLIGALGVAVDVTARKQLEANLAASEARFRGIAEQSPVMIWRTGVDGLCDYVNQTYCDFIGRPSELFLGDRWKEVVHPDDLATYSDRFSSALRQRQPFEETFRLLRRDGQYRWITSRGAPFFDASGQFQGYLGSSLDVTPRIELEKLLEEQCALAEESSRHKSRLVSALSHDARTPLNAVVLASHLLELHFDGNADAEVEECLRTIRHSVRNVLDLLTDLLDLSRIDAGALPAEISQFPLEQVLAECLASVETQARVKGLEVRLDFGTLTGASLETDRAKLKQIVANFLSNALRYTEKGHIRLFAERVRDQIRIGVEDTGVGIEPADQGLIFDEFATLANGRRELGEGTGLGLAICRRLASLLRGEITLKSAPGVGSTFALVLPDSVLTRTQPPPPSSVDLDAPGARAILIAEDHLDSRQTLAKVLRRMGYRVLEAGNGRDALAQIQVERPLAVLMDVNMPVMDGIEATLAIRADPRSHDLPIFALTGDVTMVNQHRIGEAGVNGYLEKPVTWEALKQVLSTLNHSPDHA